MTTTSKQPVNLQTPPILGAGILIPFSLLMLYIFLPAEIKVPEIKLPTSEQYALPVSLKTYALIGLFLFHFHLCISLTYDGFSRFSRFRLSQKHPFLSNILSTALIVLNFVGLAPVTLLLKSYSLLVSPDDKKIQQQPLYNRPFLVPLIQASILLIAILIIFCGDKA